ncbi:unnamed protein product [Ilex paraguariensis]|uniref:Calmodulin-binding domain-containing protein n=1 Tax=Ilex paraguariensis TaxID=185542 RepID=A0ABC8RYH1_9AQUA
MGAIQVSPVGVSRTNGEIKISNVMGASKMSKKNDKVPPTIYPSPKPPVKKALSTNPGNSRNPKNMSHPMIETSAKKVETEQPSYEKVPEKTLYVIEPNAENQTMGLAENGGGQIGADVSLSPPSPENEKLRNPQPFTTQLSSSAPLSSNNKDLRRTQNATSNKKSSSFSKKSSSLILLSSKSLRSTQNGSIRTCKSEKQIPDPKIDTKSRPKRVGRIISEDRDCSPQKLKFRRGKVVDIQSINRSPRRLRFRQQKILSENQNDKPATKTRSLRDVVSDGESKGTKSESVKVVLRHQIVEGRKDTQSLFNNVIEETASKLVQTRKSKVKALVGAFETVISLQDRKPQPAISTS